jgi:hypothetical protein
MTDWSRTSIVYVPAGMSVTAAPLSCLSEIDAGSATVPMSLV